MNIYSVFFMFLIFIILLSETSYGFQIGITPTKTDVSAEINESVCSDFSILYDGDENILIDLKWSDSNTKNIPDYFYESEQIGIKYYYNFIDKEEKFRNYYFCLRGEEPGIYNGLLTARIEGGNSAVGMWVDFELYGKKNVFNYLGNFISEEPKVKDSPDSPDIPDNQGIEYVVAFLTFSSFFLVIILFFIIYKFRRRNISNKPYISLLTD